MPSYRLVASGRHDVKVDELILSRDETGEVEDALSTDEAHELSDESLEAARNIAGNLGYQIIEVGDEPVDAPADGPEVEQPSGEPESQQAEPQQVTPST